MEDYKTLILVPRKIVQLSKAFVSFTKLYRYLVRVSVVLDENSNFGFPADIPEVSEMT